MTLSFSNPSPEPYVLYGALMTYLVVKLSHYLIGNEAKRKRELLILKGYSQRDVWVTVMIAVCYIMLCPVIGMIALYELSEVVINGDGILYPATGASIAAMVFLIFSLWMGIKSAAPRVGGVSGAHKHALMALYPIEVIASAAIVYLVTIFGVGAILLSVVLRSKSIGN